MDDNENRAEPYIQFYCKGERKPFTLRVNLIESISEHSPGITAFDIGQDTVILAQVNHADIISTFMLKGWMDIEEFYPIKQKNTSNIVHLGDQNGS